MSAKKLDFGDILIRQGTISAEQLGEAKRVAKTSGKKVHEQLVVLGYATGDEVMRTMAKEHGLDFIDLNEVAIPPSVIELVPESVARENAVLPMAEEDGALKVIVSDPLDFDTFEKLRFILARDVNVALARATRSWSRSTATTARWRIRVPTRCFRNSPIRRSISPKPSKRRAAATR